MHRLVGWVAILSAFSGLVIACGGGMGTGTQPVAEPPPPPARSAIQDRTMRQLVTDLVAHRVCSELSGDLLGLSGEQPRPGGTRREMRDPMRSGLTPKEGRLWVERCETRIVGEETGDDQLDVTLGGRGWRWLEKRVQKAGATFDLREYIRFRASINLRGQLDIAYARDRHVVTIWLTPSRRPGVRVTPTLEPEVDARGPWSGLVDLALGAFTTRDAEDRSETAIREQGSAAAANRLGRGMTLTLDLCTGQLDTTSSPLPAGAVAARPYPARESWVENERVRLRPGGLDASGPFVAGDEPVRVEIDVEQGPSVMARLVCAADAAPAIDAFLSGRRVPEVPARAEMVAAGGATTSLVSPAGETCPLVLLTTPISRGSDPTVFRYVTYADHHPHEALVDCGHH